ncbi:MAG: phytanoyl-CoA dioxygenase family protein [Pseudomonadota bacterium]|nr:phytanoyl-CoA dioxygenase family protein [Pseudomonadota bacterium]
MAGRLSSWWRAPWWLLQLVTGAKSFVDNPILGSEVLNRRGLHGARLRAAHRLAWWRRGKLARDVDPADRAAFDRDGFVCLPDFLPADQFEHLRQVLLGTEWDGREQRQGDTITRRVPIDAALLDSSPELAQLLAMPRWRSLMRYVASTGGEPIYYLQSIVTGLDGPPDPQVDLHSDAFHPSLKAWLFLTDVAEDAAPFTYVPGSHRLSPQRLQWEQRKSETVAVQGDRLSQRGSFRVSRQELAELGLPEPASFAVRANTLVVADTFGFHARGPSQGPTVRAELWAYRRRTPFLPWTGFDLLSLPAIAPRRAGWAYALVDRLAARGLRQQHWIPSGRKRATDR